MQTMNSSQASDGVKKVTKADLPLQMDDVPTSPSLGGATLIAMGIQVAAVAIFGFAIYWMVFGPEYITIDRFAGPTLWQTFLVHPSYLVYVGLAVSMLGRLISSTNDKTAKEARQRKISEHVARNYQLCDAAGEPLQGAILTTDISAGGQVELGYEERASADKAPAA